MKLEQIETETTDGEFRGKVNCHRNYSYGKIPATSNYADFPFIFTNFVDLESMVQARAQFNASYTQPVMSTAPKTNSFREFAVGFNGSFQRNAPEIVVSAMRSGGVGGLQSLMSTTLGALHDGAARTIEYQYPFYSTPSLEAYIKEHNASVPVWQQIPSHKFENGVRTFMLESILTAGLGKGRFGTVVTAERAGASSSKIAVLAGDLESHLGPGFTKIESPTGNSIFRSVDGTKQIRFDLNDFHGDPNGAHINLETWAQRNLYPGDTRMQQIENLHIYPKGP